MKRSGSFYETHQMEVRNVFKTPQHPAPTMLEGTGPQKPQHQFMLLRDRPLPASFSKSVGLINLNCERLLTSQLHIKLMKHLISKIRAKAEKRPDKQMQNR